MSDIREGTIKKWFDMWLIKDMSGVEDLFSEDAVYIESWGPKYEGIEKIKLWFKEWNQRGSVREWEIYKYFHSENQSVVTWYFSCEMTDGSIEKFDGTSLISWNYNNKIEFLKEFACKKDNYDPYLHGDIPVFKN